MSAFLVNAEHIAEIVKFAQNNKLDHAYNCATQTPIDTDPKQLVALLAQANIDSLVARYGEDPKDFDGFIEDCLADLQYSTDGASIVLGSQVGHCQLSAGDIYNMVTCWDYQSCEVDNWTETDAYWVGIRIKDIASRKLAENASVRWAYSKNSEVA